MKHSTFLLLSAVHKLLCLSFLTPGVERRVACLVLSYSTVFNILSCSAGDKVQVVNSADENWWEVRMIFRSLNKKVE